MPRWITAILLTAMAGSSALAAPYRLPELPKLRPAPRPAPTPPAEDPAVPTRRGRFLEDGRYVRDPEVQRFLDLHGQRDIPRYPIALVHGLFGYKTLKIGPFRKAYFRGVEKHFKEEGIEVFLPVTTPFASFEKRATQLKEQLLATGWEKFHIIAHSAGGLDSRYMVSKLGMGDRVASITTVSTPHRGVWYADFAIKWVFERQRFWKVWDWLGVHREGIPGISVAGMREFNATTPDHPDVKYFSFGGAQGFHKIVPPLSTAMLINKVAERAAAGRRPNLAQRLLMAPSLPRRVRKQLKRDPQAVIREAVGEVPDWIDPRTAGLNDGLVSLSSARWGTYLGDLNADHLDEMGWLTFFNAPRFYRNITRMLYDLGM